VILISILTFASTVQTSYCSVNNIEFRLVLDDMDMAGRDHDTVINGKEALRILRPYFLSDSDMDEIMILQSAVSPGKVMTGFRFNEQGKKHLAIILNKFPGRRIAIFAGKKFVTVLPVLPSGFSSDMIVITWPGKERELRKIASEINKKPASILTLYIDETAKYNEIAAEEWAKAYDKVASALEEKYREARSRARENQIEGDN
jgi:hypothetical protein